MLYRHYYGKEKTPVISILEDFEGYEDLTIRQLAEVICSRILQYDDLPIPDRVQVREEIISWYGQSNGWRKYV